MSETLFAYAAGFIDGEGCIYINRRKQPNRPKVYNVVTIHVAQKSKMQLEFMQNVFGGTLKPITREGFTVGQYWYWSLYGNNAERFLEHIVPYLVLKREKAEEALRYLKTRQQRRKVNSHLSPATTNREGSVWEKQRCDSLDSADGKGREAAEMTARQLKLVH